MPVARAGDVDRFASFWGRTLSNRRSSLVWPPLVLSDWKKYPVTLGIALFREVNAIDCPFVFAGLTVISFPIIILFIIAQEYISGGISLSGLKG